MQLLPCYVKYNFLLDAYLDMVDHEECAQVNIFDKD